MCKDLYSRSQKDAKAKNWSSSKESGPNQWLAKTQKVRMNPPQFSHYEPNVLRMMENMGYDLTSDLDLNFGKGRRTLLRSFVPKGKAPYYYHQTRRGLDYVSTPIPSASESEESLYHNHSSGRSLWELDVSVGNIFKELSVNMDSTSHLKNGDKEMI